jgi:hypothetical protein
MSFDLGFVLIEEQSQSHSHFPYDYFRQTWASPDFPEYFIQVDWNSIGPKLIYAKFRDDIIDQQDILTMDIRDLLDVIVKHRDNGAS